MRADGYSDHNHVLVFKTVFIGTKRASVKSQAVLLMWFSMFLVLVSCSGVSPSVCLDLFRLR